MIRIKNASTNTIKALIQEVEDRAKLDVRRRVSEVLSKELSDIMSETAARVAASIEAVLVDAGGEGLEVRVVISDQREGK